MKGKYINTDSSGQEFTDSVDGMGISCYISRFLPETYSFIDWHWHRELQLCVVTEGSVLWSVAEKSEAVSKGDGVFINSSKVHMAKCLGERAAFFCLDVCPEFFNEDRESRIYSRYVNTLINSSLSMKVIKSGENGNITEILTEMARCFEEKNFGYELFLCEKTYALLRHLLKLTENEKTLEERDKSERLKTIFDFIRKNYSEDICLEDIAKSVSLSRSECCRYFKAQTGTTVFDYLTMFRIMKSTVLLKNSDLSVARIAAEVGFSSQSYYTNRFKEKMKLTPAQYRKKHKTAENQ